MDPKCTASPRTTDAQEGPTTRGSQRREAREALRAMGLLDQEELARWTGSFSRLKVGLALYLMAHDGPSFRAPHVDSACWQERELRRLERAITAFLRRAMPACNPRVALFRAPTGAVTLRVDDVERALGEHPSRGIYAALHRWTRRHDASPRLWLDALGRLCWLSEQNVAAICHHGALSLRLVHDKEPGAPHAEVEAVWRRLERLDLRASRARRRLGWEVDLYRPAVMARRHSYETQILDLDERGLLFSDVELGATWDGAQVAERLADAMGLALQLEPQRQPFDLHELLMQLNVQLRLIGSPWQLLAIRCREHWVRVLWLLPEAVFELAARVEVLAGVAHRNALLCDTPAAQRPWA